MFPTPARFPRAPPARRSKQRNTDASRSRREPPDVAAPRSISISSDVAARASPERDQRASTALVGPWWAGTTRSPGVGGA